MKELLPKQKQAYKKHLSNKVGALFMKMGTGCEFLSILINLVK